jgi:hypothetical protein
MPDNAHDPERFEKAFIASFLEVYEAAVPRQEQRSVDASKWSLAALLTINGGGVLGIINAGERFENPILPASIYLIGMSAAVLTAAAIRVAVAADLNHAQLLFGKAKRASIGVESSLLVYNYITKSIGRRKKIGEHFQQIIPFALEAMSGIAFLCASVVSVQTIDPGSAANDARCVALQADFLSAKPKRPDSREMFEALKCRPQGEGSVYAPPRS